MDSYYFRHWANIDTFVYFSHHLLTIPPPGLIILIFNVFTSRLICDMDLFVFRLGSCRTSSRCAGDNPKSTHVAHLKVLSWSIIQSSLLAAGNITCLPDKSHGFSQVLGTFITEWDPGRILLESLLEDEVPQIHLTFSIAPLITRWRRTSLWPTA